MAIILQLQRPIQSEEMADIVHSCLANDVGENFVLKSRHWLQAQNGNVRTVGSFEWAHQEGLITYVADLQQMWETQLSESEGEVYRCNVRAMMDGAREVGVRADVGLGFYIHPFLGESLCDTPVRSQRATLEAIAKRLIDYTPTIEKIAFLAQKGQNPRVRLCEYVRAS